MGDITKNISRHELRCPCLQDCGYEFVDYETINIVQDACDHFAAKLGVAKVVLIINSAARCLLHNKAVNGAAGSKHLRGGAVDIWIKGVSIDDLFDYLNSKYPDRFGIGKYRTFVHIDSRTVKARWVG